MQKSAFPGLLAWLAAIALHAGVVWLVAPLGIVFAVALMATMPVTTWIRLGIWLLIGLTIYFLYARHRSGERMERLAAVEAAHPGPVA